MVLDIQHHQLRDATLFQDFPDEVLMNLAAHCRTIHLPAGETLFQQSDPGNNFYLLIEGQIHIVRHYPSGEDIILATEGPYYVVGELSMLANKPRTGGVVAVSDSTLIALDRSHFIEACEENPKVAVAVLSYLSARLYRMNLSVREHAVGNVNARVANILLLLCDDAAESTPAMVHVNRIARAIAVDSALVDSVLREWARQNYIAYAGSKISILDIEAIRKIAG